MVNESQARALETQKTAPAVNADLQPGTSTSSFKVVLLTLLFTIIGPLVPLIVAVLVTKGIIPLQLSQLAEQTLNTVLTVLAGALGIGGAYAVSKVGTAFVNMRGEISKIKALAATGVTSTATPQQTVNISQTEKEGDS